MAKTRNTRQKELLRSEIEKIKTFFSAEDLHARLIHKKIGIATVYRFLAALRRRGTLCSFSCAGKTLYSASCTHHCHFICERCGAVSHFTIKDISFLKNKVAGRICHFQIEVTGFCEGCQKKISKPISQQSL